MTRRRVHPKPCLRQGCKKVAIVKGTCQTHYRQDKRAPGTCWRCPEPGALHQVVHKGKIVEEKRMSMCWPHQQAQKEYNAGTL